MKVHFCDVLYLISMFRKYERGRVSASELK